MGYMASYQNVLCCGLTWGPKGRHARAGPWVQHLLTYTTVQMAVQSAHLCRLNSYPLRPRRVTWIKTKRVSLKGECSGALQLDWLGLRCKANKCSDTGAGDLGVLNIYEASPCFSLGEAGSTRHGRMSPQDKIGAPRAFLTSGYESSWSGTGEVYDLFGVSLVPLTFI